MTMGPILTPHENFYRTKNLVCPNHPDSGDILPAHVCPFCHWPEEVITTPVERSYQDMIHKATPSETDEFACATCGGEIKRVPGGNGSTYVHTDTGAVAAGNPKGAA